MTVKRGPMGQALVTSLNELTLLPQSLLNNIKLIGGSSLSDSIEGLLDGFDALEILRMSSVTIGTFFSISE
jgi:hypothetical protein